MYQLLDSLLNLIVALWQVGRDIFVLVLPWTPLLAWVAFWLLAVNWVKYRAVLVKGGWTGLFLIGLTMILIWGLIAPPADGVHSVFGLSLSNFVGKTVYVTSLFSIMFLCGSVQLSGACGSLVCFKDEEESPDHGHAAAH
ncbi:MAG: hypothetical protein O3B13_07205 [Planctomycetota bacterium]|nr:hypothetical protein [Planctomycetota bacterium]MDA1162871.1 hypothetical protein [Planctomycetota bacterium]